MRRILIALQALLIPLLMSAQINMSVNGRAELDPQDNDARSYYALRDANDLDCAIIKVSLNNPVNGTLVLQTKGGSATVKTEKQTNGEWWFWVSPVVTNIMFSCEGYTPTPYVGVTLRGKSVYRMKLTVDAAVATVTTFTLGSSVMKLNVTPPDATVFYGRTPDCDMGSRTLSDGLFEEFLDNGTYYYRIESRFYEKLSGKYEVNEHSREVSVSLTPAFSYLGLDSSPQGADVYVNGRFIGTTPLAKSDKVRKGESVRVEFRLKDYYIEPITVNVVGDGKVQKVPTVNLRPQFGWVTCLCDDPEAELVVSDATKEIARGKSGMRVKLNSGGTTYKLESLRPSHHPQAQGIKGSMIEGKDVELRVESPVPIYGGLQLTSTPSRARVFIDGVEVGTTALSQRVLIGRHTVELKLNGYHLDPFTVNIEEGQTTQISKALISGPKIVGGTLKVTTGKETSANVKVFNAHTSKTGYSPFTANLPAGYYNVEAKKSGFKTATGVAKVNEGKVTNLDLKLHKEVNFLGWKWSWEEDKFAKHFFDFNVAIRDYDVALGFEYAYCQKHLGAYGRYLYSVDEESTSISAGPVIRLTWDYRKVDWHIYAGVGYMYGYPGVEFGTRLGWHSSDFSWFDFGIGLQSTEYEVVPVISVGLGIALFPYYILFAGF